MILWILLELDVKFMSFAEVVTIIDRLPVNWLGLLNRKNMLKEVFATGLL
jgi:hypothetical protein